MPTKRAWGRESHVFRKDVDRFGLIADCPGCADAPLGITGRHTHNNERQSIREVDDG